MIRLRVDASMTSPFDPDLSVGRSGELVKADASMYMPVRKRMRSRAIRARAAGLGAGGGDGNLVANPDFESGAPGQEAPGWSTWQKR